MTATAAHDSPDPAMIELRRDAFGRIVLTRADGSRCVGITPVRAFPLSAPHENISLVGPNGRECFWLADLSMLDAGASALIGEELSLREFAPEISRIHSISSSSGASYWQVATDRGETRFTLRAGETVRRLAHGHLQLVDDSGVRYVIRDPEALDARSRRLLDRYR